VDLDHRRVERLAVDSCCHRNVSLLIGFTAMTKAIAEV
jgi:hypothetical protein